MGKWGEEIRQVLADFYQDLYASEGWDLHKENIMRDFFQDLTLTSVSLETANWLMRDIEPAELEYVLTRQKKNKMPGADGLPLELWIRVKPMILQLWVPLFNEILRCGSPPRTPGG